MDLVQKSKSARELTAHLVRCFRHNECEPLYTDLAQLYGRYGRKLEFSLDSSLRRLDIVVSIAGKEDPLKVSVQEYRMVEEDARQFLVLDGIETSWRWLNLILRGSGLGVKKIAVSREHAAYLQAALFPQVNS